MLYRKAYDKLLEWKKQSKRKALCIMGARQIGKTTVIRQFGKEKYECFVEINFITDPNAAKIFAGLCEYEESYAYLGNGTFVLCLKYDDASFSRRINIIKAISMKNKGALDRKIQ